MISLLFAAALAPCTSPDALAVVTYITGEYAQTIEGGRVRIELDNYEYLSIWQADGAEGLGVSRNQPAEPNDAEFSPECRALIFNKLETR